jgi:hypothetical protein
MLTRRVEVDEVGDREREAQGDVGQCATPPAAAGCELLDERIPAGAAECEDLLERRVRLAVDDLGAVSPTEPR